MHSEELKWTEPGVEEPEEGTLVNAEYGDDDGEGLAPGSRLGRYVVLSKMGAGGMGVVYAAYDPELDRRVALKLMHQQVGVSEVEAEQASRRLLAEAKAMAQLSHPNVITVHDVGTIGDRVFIAMEFVDGVPLSTWMREPGRDWQVLLEVFMKAGRGLEAAHQAGLVHRDFKPDNVLVDTDGRVRVLDFGLARRYDGRESGEKRRDKEAGTPAYMSPEQHLAKDLDHRSDQFSFCVALYEALYGELPFSAKTRFELAMAVTDGRVAPAPKGATVPSWLRWALLRGLDPDPDGRWPDMGELLAALTQDPYRRWRSVAVWVASGLLVLAGAFAVFELVSDGEGEGEGEDEQATGDGGDGLQTCGAGEDELAEVWNPDRAEQLQQVFADSKLAINPSLAAVLGDDLQRWADDWKAAHDEACDAWIDRTQSDTLYDRRMICLRSKLAEVDALLEVITGGQVERLGWVGAETLPDLQTCSAEVLSAAVASRRVLDETQRGAVSKVEGLLFRARNLEKANNLGEARTLSAQALDEARSLGEPQTLADALFARAEILLTGDDVDEAIELLGEAELAAERAGADRLRANVLLALGRAYLDRGGHGGGQSNQVDIAAAAHRVAQARAVLDRVEAEPLAYARLAAVGGLVELAAGHGERAEAELNQAIASLAKDTPPPVELAELRNALGMVLLARGQVDRAREQLELARVQWTEHYGGQDPTVASARIHLAIVAEASGAAEEALTEYDGALAIYEQTFGPSSMEVGNVLVAKAAILHRIGRNDEALGAYQKARAVFQGRGDDGLASFAGVLADEAALRHELGQNEQALGLLEQSLATWEQIRDPESPALALPLIRLGEVLLALDRPAEARRHLMRANGLAGEDRREQATLHRALAQAWADGDGADPDRVRLFAAEARNDYEVLGDRDALAALDVWLEAQGRR